MGNFRQPTRLLRWPQLAEIVPYTRQHISRLEDAGLFPNRLQIGSGAVAWREDEIRDWIETRTRGRRASPRAA